MDFILWEDMDEIGFEVFFLFDLLDRIFFFFEKKIKTMIEL